MNRLYRRLAIIAMLTVSALLVFNYIVMPSDKTSKHAHLRDDLHCNCHSGLTDEVKPHLRTDRIEVPPSSDISFTAGSVKNGFVNFKEGSDEYTFRLNSKMKPSTCPTSLQKKVLESPWFAAKYRPDIQMLADETLLNTSEYKRLLPYWMPFGYKYHENITEEELQQVYTEFPNTESIFRFEDYERPPCISCAVVGTGGVLNGSNMGKEIDSHDMVFRVNNAVRKGYEKDVGEKLTHYVFFDRSLIYSKGGDLPNDKGVTYVFVPCRKQDLNYILVVIGKGKSRKPAKITTTSDNIRILHPDFVRYVHKIWENTTSFRPSTGAIMAMTALHAGCDHVSLYGMGFTYQYSSHYYDPEYVKYANVKGSHDFKREISIWGKLHQDGIARWYKRDVADFT